jgi:hypothetical protein
VSTTIITGSIWDGMANIMTSMVITVTNGIQIIIEIEDKIERLIMVEAVVTNIEIF